MSMIEKNGLSMIHTMPDERVNVGYRECVECSSVEPYSTHVVYPHKTAIRSTGIIRNQKEFR